MSKLQISARTLFRGSQKRSVKAGQRKFRSDFLNDLYQLEKRVLLADISITQPSDLAAYFDSANNTYNIDAGKDNVTINSGLTLVTTIAGGPAAGFIITGDQVSIGANVSIITDGGGSSQAYASGNIEIKGRQIQLGNNVLVSANGSTDAMDGNLTVSAENERIWSLGFNAWLQVEDLVQLFLSQAATIEMGSGTQFVGGAMKLEAASGNPLQFESYTKAIEKVAGILEASKGHPNLLSIPATFQSWSPYSGISFGPNVGLASSSTIDVSATAESNAQGVATWFETAWTGFGLAMGFFFTDVRANINMAAGASLQAADDVDIAANVTNNIDLEVTSLKNRGVSPVNPNAVNIAYGIGSLTTDCVIDVQAGSSIISQTGSVNIAATADDSNQVTVESKSYRDGLATISVGTVLTTANVQVIVDGTVSSGVAQQANTAPTAIVFDQVQSVDLAHNQLNFPAGATTFKTGQAVLFDTGNGSTIPGLVPGQVYYTILPKGQPNSVQLATSAANAQNGINITFPTVYPTLTIGDYILPITAIDSTYSNAILYTFNTLPDGSPVLPGGNGTTVTYTPVAGQFIGVNDANGNLLGPLPAGTYTVKLFDWPQGSMESSVYPLAIQLVNSLGQTVNLNPNSYFTTSDGTNYQVALFNAETSTVNFNFTTPPDSASGLTPLPVPNQQVNLPNGAPLVYTSGLNAPIGNLVNGQTYWAVANQGVPGIIQLATTLAQSEAANPAVQDALPSLQTVANQACLAAAVADDFISSDEYSTLTLNSNNSYSLSNNASGGSFQLAVNGPTGTLTTAALAYNVSAAQLQSALNAISGVQATVSDVGGSGQAWSIAIVFNFEIGNFFDGTQLTFDSKPNLSDGSAVVFVGIPGKPVPGLVSGQTYYAFNQPNPDLITQFPQYILTLKNSNDISAQDVSVDLSQSMTDTSGKSYQISYTDASGGLISLALPEVTSPVAVDGSALTSGTVSANQLATPALSIYTVATSGTFILSLTNWVTGTTQTTAPIAFNASAAAFQQALNAIVGVNAVVLGQGTYTSPWTVMGIDPQWSVTSDNSNLKYQDTPSAVSLDVVAANTQQVWLTGAAGGTFTVTLNFGASQLVTVALPYNATRNAFAQAINTQGFQAAIYGSGTASDPWQFLAYYNPVRTGSVLTFNDAWNNNSLGMLNGQSYYAVTSETQFSAGEVMLGLAASLANATANPPVLLNMQGYLQFEGLPNGVMSGPAALVSVEPAATGIKIAAQLNSRDYLTNKGEIGGYPPMQGFLNQRNGINPYDISKITLAKRDLASDRKILSEFMADGDLPFEAKEQFWKTLKTAIDKNKEYLKNFDYKDPKHFLEASLGLAVQTISNNSQVIIGSHAHINSSGNVALNATLTDQFHAQADAGVTRTTESESKTGNVATALGLAVAVLNNTSQVVVQPNAVINATGQISLDSNVSYPFAWKESRVAQLITNWSTQDWLHNSAGVLNVIGSVISQALNGTGAGIGNWLFNSSSNSATVQESELLKGLLGSAIGGSVVVVDITNDNLSQICDGAQINQSPDFTQDVDQGIAISATTAMDQLSASGQMDLFLNLAGFATRDYLSSSKAKNIIGGSVNVMSMDNSTQALLGGDAPQSVNATANSANGPTQLNYGNNGLALSAITDVNYITLSQSGGQAVGVGLEASVAVANVENQNSTAAVLSAANAPVIRNMANSAGNIAISASDDSMLVPASGGILAGKAINLGFSSSAVKLNRNVSAFVGQANTTVAPDQAPWPVIQSAGNITIQSTAGGQITPVSLAGSVIARGVDDKGKMIPGFPGNRFGFGVSADYSEAVVNDQVNAGFNGASVSGISNQQVLSVQATNQSRVNVTTGSASLQFEKGRNSVAGLGGAGSYTSFASTVLAQINSANITTLAVQLEALNSKTIGSFSAGLDGASVAGLGIAVAGSVAINEVTNQTVAEMTNSTASGLGAIAINAVETDKIWAGAGTVTFVTSLGSDAELDPGKLKTKIGFGLGFAQNLLDSTTQAIISNASLAQSSGGLNLNAIQASQSFVLSAGAVLEAGKGTQISAYGMVALNQYTNGDVQAQFENSQISSSSTDPSAGIAIAAQLIPVMVTAAGDLGLGIAWKEGKGAQVNIGAGVSVTQISITGNAIATVGNSNIVLNQGNLSVNAYTGQAANSTSLNNTLANLNLPQGNYNLYSLAIAGGLTAAIAPEGSLALGVDGVGAGIGSTTAISTLANITSGSNINLLGQNQSGGQLSISALENLNVYDNAGGASIDIQVSKSTSIGVVVGIGAAVHNGSGGVAAGVFDSNVTTAGSANISAYSNSSTSLIGFGVALDVSVATSGGMSFALSASSATGTINSSQAITACISGGMINSGGALSLSANDHSSLYTGLGSGSLSVGFGEEGGASLASGDSVSQISPSHTISAAIGSTNANSPVQTIVNAKGPVTIEAVNNQAVMAQAIAVASSVMVSGEASVSLTGAGASSTITTNNNITATIHANSSLHSSLMAGNAAISITAVDQANLSATVGTGAVDVSISEVPIGASLGISLSQITNNDQVNALLQGANLTTSGGDVLVEAVGKNRHFSESVATSISISLGVAGAGGNSNVYDNSDYFATVDSDSSIITGNAQTGFGGLAVLANSAETVVAQIFGGTGGIGSIGVFMSNATRGGSSMASLTTSGPITVGNLTVAAVSNQTVTSEGMSATIGGLAGTGEVHRVNVSELVQTNINGYGNSWNIYGHLSIGAQSEDNATARTSGAGNGGTSVSIGELGAGYFDVSSSVSPTVNVTVANVNLSVSGTSRFGAIAISNNNATARAGSGSLVGGDAAEASTDNSPTVCLTTTSLTLNSGSTTFLTATSVNYGTFADSIFATLVGGSAALAYNSSTPNQSLNLGSGTSINACGSVVISSVSNITGMGLGENSKGAGVMSRVGAGGLAAGYGASSHSCLTGQSSIQLADGVAVLAQSGGAILIGSTQNWATNQLSYVNTGSAVGGTAIESLLLSNLTNQVEIGDNVSLTATAGAIGIGTSINSQTTSDCYSYTFGLVSGSSSNAQNNQCSTQSVTIGTNAILMAAGDISVTPGANPVSQFTTFQDIYSIITAHCSGLISIPTTSANATSNSNLNLVIDAGSQIVSDLNVTLGPQQGTNSALWYTFTNYNGSKGKTKDSTNGVTQTATATINGNVVAGSTHLLNIAIPESGKVATVNGQNVTISDTSGTLVPVVPEGGLSFLPFQVGYQTNYNATQMLAGLDATSVAMLNGYISKTPVPAITLANVSASGGQVVINASQLYGTGTISAYVPNITINNNSPAYLLLDGVGIPNTLNMGKITVNGGADVPAGMTLNQQSGLPSITIHQNYCGPVGSGTTAGPALGSFGPIINSGGSVSISNANGSFVQQSAITAQSVSINTPNAAFIVNTPNQYYGSGGNITDYWTNSASYITPGLNSCVTAYTANLAATTAADILYLAQSGATNSIEFSNWLYNNKSIPITNFVNVNISANDIGNNYPGTGKNWGTTEHGTGIIFFGSEIPYIWQTSPVTFSSGSQYLSQSCATGYLDTYLNASIYSVAASGNPNDGNLNVAQGTGPQYAANVGRGIYPVVPSYFPTSLTVNNPQNATLGNGVTAGQISVTALYIDINAPINVGVLNSGFQATLPATLGEFIQSQLAGNPSTACIALPANYLGGANSGITGYYDIQANQIVLSPVAINAGTVGAVFTGNIISTTNAGMISVTSNGGQNLIDNQSGYPLVVQGISTSGNTVSGVVQFNDTVANLSTAYVYRANNIVEKYQGAIGSNISQMTPAGNMAGTSAAYSPQTNLAWQWSQQAAISRQLSFTNNNNNYALYGPSFNDSWYWGNLTSGDAANNSTSSINPFSASLTSGLAVLPAPISQLTENISASITSQQTATTYFINDTGYAWNFGPCTTWTWTYPTEIQIGIKNQLPACNPIAIDFSGVQSGSLAINSCGSLLLDGNIQFAGHVSLGSGQGISQAAGAVVRAPQVCLTACGSVGSSAVPININVNSNTPVNANAGTGLHLSTAGNMVAGSLAVANGPVMVQTGGGLSSGGGGVNVSGTNVTILAANGSIGSQAAPIVIQTMPSQLVTGSVAGGLLTVSAPESIFLSQPTGDLRIAAVATSSPVGVVSITTPNGNITNGNMADVYDFNSSNLTRQQISRVIDAIGLDNANSANTTVAAFEGSVNQDYLQYWTMVANQTTIGNLTLNNGVYGLQFPLSTVANGVVALTANGVLYYQQQANQYYFNTANQSSNATPAQVNAFAGIIYNNAVNVFQNNLAFGPGWSAQAPFQAYNSNFIFTASNTTVSALTYGAYDVTNAYALLSLDALSPAGQDDLGQNETPVIRAVVLNLNASGSVGLMLDPVEIDMGSIQTGNLTAYQKSLLAKATNAGELQFIGINANGERVVYSAGSEPANVTTTGVLVKINQPLPVNLAQNGIAIITSGSTINLTGSDGSLNILSATAPGNISLVARQNIVQVGLQTSTSTTGWSLNGDGILGFNANGGSGNWAASSLQFSGPVVAGISADSLRLVAGGSVGSVDNRLNISVLDRLNAFAQGDLQLQSKGSLLLGEINSGGQANIAAGGNILASTGSLKGSIGGFGGDGAEWKTNAYANGNATFSDNNLTLSQAQPTAGGISSASAFYGMPLTVENSFIASFLYQSSTVGSTFYFLIQNSQSAGDPAGQTTVGLQINTPSATPQLQSVGVLNNGMVQDVQMPGGINFASGHLIHVVLTYNSVNHSMTILMTDTSTGLNYAFQSGGVNLFQVLGSAQGQIGFFASANGQPAAQSVSGFSFSYGSPTIQAPSLGLNAGGTIGAANSPILTLVSGNISATAPGGVSLLQTDGDMYVQSIASVGNVSLNAPVGSVVGTGAGPIQASGLVRAAAWARPGSVTADQLQIQSLINIESAGKPLDITASGLAASTVIGDVRLNQRSTLAVNGGIWAGGLISLAGDSGISVSSAVQAAGPISISTLPNLSGYSRIIVTAGGSIVSRRERVALVGGDGVSLLAGSSLASLGAGERSQILLKSLAGELLVSEKYDVSVNGGVRADQIRIVSISGNHNHYLNLAGITGLSGTPVVDVVGTAGNNTLTVDDIDHTDGRSFTLENNHISFPIHLINYSAIDSVIMTLGSGPDLVQIGRHTGLNQLDLNTGPGDDIVHTLLSSTEPMAQNIDGGPGTNRLFVDADNQPVWMKNQQVAALAGKIGFRNQGNVIVSRTHVANALPVADRFVFSVIADGVPLSNKEFVALVYQQVLNRNATANELAMGFRQLDRKAVDRYQFARRMLAGTESLRSQVNAWYLTYLNRQASRQELTQSVAAMRRGQSAQKLISRILAGQEFYNRIQKMVQTGSATDRYITGLYRLAIDPASGPNTALMQLLRQTLQEHGRLGVSNQVLGSTAIEQNQTQAISLKTSHRPSKGSVTVGQVGPNGLTARLLSRK